VTVHPMFLKEYPDVLLNWVQALMNKRESGVCGQGSAISLSGYAASILCIDETAGRAEK
jgi:hypothetical protein